METLATDAITFCLGEQYFVVYFVEGFDIVQIDHINFFTTDENSKL